MHIAYLHYLYSRKDGTRDRTRHFTGAIRELGHEVKVHAMNLAPPAATAGSAPVRLRLRAALKRRLGRYLHDPKDLVWNARYLQRELQLLRAERPDVLIVRPMSLFLSAIPASRRLGIPLVLEVHAPISELRVLAQYAHLPLVHGWVEGYRLRHADAITVVSSPLRDYFVDRYRLPADKFVVVPNGADLERFHPEVEPDREMSSALGGGPVIGFVGSFQAWHGAAALARMCETVAAQHPASRFLFVGDGPGAADLKRTVDDLQDRAVMTGWLPHARIPGLVATIDIGVLPESDFYRCPLKLIEWMAAGLAVVVPRHAPLVELVEEEVEGIFFEPGDTAGLIRAVERLIENPELRRRLGTAAAKRVRESMSWANSARRVAAACELAISRRQL